MFDRTIGPAALYIGLSEDGNTGNSGLRILGYFSLLKYSGDSEGPVCLRASRCAAYGYPVSSANGRRRRRSGVFLKIVFNGPSVWGVIIVYIPPNIPIG
jgi:hypothetical protein